MVAIWHKLFDKWEKSEAKIANEPKRPEFVEHKHAHVAPQQTHKWGISAKTLNFILSLLIAVIIYLRSLESTQIYSITLISVLVGFIVFLLLNAVFKANISKGKKQWRMSMVYVFLLAISLWLWIFGYLLNDTESDNNIDKNDNIVTSWQVLESWMNILDDFIKSGSVTTWIIPVETWTIIQTWTETAVTPTPTAGESLKIIDAIRHLFDKYGTTLSTKTDVSFTYVSKTSPIYPIYRTAYEKRMIWKSTNPTKMILCDSYIVMKWLMWKWNVTYNATNVTTQFRNEAIARWALNGCQKGKTVKEVNL